MCFISSSMYIRDISYMALRPVTWCLRTCLQQGEPQGVCLRSTRLWEYLHQQFVDPSLASHSLDGSS